MPGKKLNSDRAVAEQLCEQVFSLTDDIRYVAVSYRGRLASVAKPIPTVSGWWDADQYEELIVNPTLITLFRQRGMINGGGIRHIIIQYGNVTQFVRPIDGGHISVSFEPTSNHPRLLSKITKLLNDKKLLVVQRT